jgi:cold shock CspA family protein
MGVVVVVGNVVRFDGVRGYGFIAPAHGGEDVFLHVNDLLIPEAAVHPGLAVEFEIENGDRGLKASAVRFASEAQSVQIDQGIQSGAMPPQRILSPEGPRRTDSDEPMCDVLVSSEFALEVTELLLETVPPLTGYQILHIRRAMAQVAKSHGWIEG